MIKEELIFKLELPLFIMINNKKYHINLNNYHCWNRFVRNKIKQTYQGQLIYEIPNELVNVPVSLELVLHRGDHRKVDRSNILCLHEKFACDAIVKKGILVDDNDSYIESTHYFTGEVDKSNPRVDLFIYKSRSKDV